MSGSESAEVSTASMSREKSFGALEPALAVDWHPTRNGALTPFDVARRSRLDVWWVGPTCGHVWHTSVHSRAVDGSGCLVCVNKQVQPGVNDLQANAPEIADEWHPILNGELLATQVSRYSHKRYWWQCRDCSHAWRAQPANRKSPSGCPACAGRVLVVGQNDLKSQRPDLAAELDVAQNNDIDAAALTLRSSKMAHWQCHTCGHRWRKRVNTRVDDGLGCPGCSGRAVVAGRNDLTTAHPDVGAEWHPVRNQPTTPDSVLPGSNTRFWWKCASCQHEWQATPNARIGGGTGCPVCSNRKTIAGLNDLASQVPELAKEWHPTANGGLRPVDLVSRSNKRVWWKCSAGHEWEASPNDRVGGRGCAKCSAWGTSKSEQLIFEWLGHGPLGDFLTGGGDVAVPVAWRKRTSMSVDILTRPFRDEPGVVIEYDGSYFHSTPESTARDLAKTQALLGAGYYVVRIRENRLPLLPLRHDRLLQISHRWSGESEHLVNTIETIEHWVASMGYLESTAA